MKRNTKFAQLFRCNIIFLAKLMTTDDISRNNVVFSLAIFVNLDAADNLHLLYRSSLIPDSLFSGRPTQSSLKISAAKWQFPRKQDLSLHKQNNYLLPNLLPNLLLKKTRKKGFS
jgi:hypothetical protein